MPKDFATTGTESFNLQSQVNQKERIVLTIQEEKPADGVILDRETMRKVGTGNIFVDAFHKINRYLMSKGKVNVKDKATFFHLLSVMINAGIPVLKALKSLMMQMDKNPKLQMIIEKISDEIEGGSTLSESLVRCDDVFSEQEVGMIQSGEASGQLAKVLDNLAVDTEKTYHIKSKVKSAMMYPMVIFVLLIGVIVAMMVFVIPGLKDLFASAGSDLPLITRIVVGLSDFMINQKFVLVGVALFLIFGFLMFRKTALGKYMIDDFKIKVPIFGTLFKKTYLARISRSLSNLMESNISIVRAIEITGNSVGNEVYKKRMLLSMEDVKQGIPLGESLSESPLFPPMLVSMIEVGEKTAQLGEITGKVATFYETEVDTSVAGISKMIEPVILVVIGLTVGGVVAAIMLPIMRLSDMAGSI